MKRIHTFKSSDYRSKKCNFHSHTKRCQHASGEEREYVEAALEQGFEVIGFSDHSPYLFKNGFVSTIRMKMNELENYVDTIEKLKAEYKNEITILSALEMEYFPDIFEPTIHEIEQYPLDYMLLAQHFFPEEDHFISVRKDWTDEAHLNRYLSLLFEALDTGCFDLVAHPDILGFVGDNSLYATYMDKLVQRLKQEQIPVEINVNGFREKCNYPDERFIKIAAANGNDFIIGVDAHHPEDYADLASYQGCIRLAQKYAGSVFWY
mgnify:CR=1 FL=1